MLNDLTFLYVDFPLAYKDHKGFGKACVTRHCFVDFKSFYLFIGFIFAQDKLVNRKKDVHWVALDVKLLELD